LNAIRYVVEVSVENFQTEVAEKSKDTPVLLEFYADGHPPSDELTPVLRRLADEYQGKFILARVDIQSNPQIAQQLGVRALPTLKIVFDGQMAQSLEGPQDEQVIRQVLDELTLSPMERVREQLDFFMAQGDRENAISMLQQLIADEPKNFVLHAELCDLLVMEDRIDEARQILAAIPPDTEGISKPLNRIEFIEKSADLKSIDELEVELAADAANLQVRFDLSVRLVADDQIEAALEHLLEAMKKDKTWEDELARQTMIKVFDLLGKGNALATSYRRKMFTFLH